MVSGSGCGSVAIGLGSVRRVDHVTDALQQRRHLLLLRTGSSARGRAGHVLVVDSGCAALPPLLLLLLLLLRLQLRLLLLDAVGQSARVGAGALQLGVQLELADRTGATGAAAAGCATG